jgi:uncharacterized protein YggE
VRARVALAVAALGVALCLAGCSFATSAAPSAVASPTVTAVGYALAPATASSRAVALHLDMLVTAATATDAWQLLGEAVVAGERALVAAGAPAAAVGVAGAPSLTAQVGPEATEASQTVIAILPSTDAVLAVLGRLRTGTLAGYDGYYVTPDSQPEPAPPVEVRADRQALASARAHAARLASAEGGRLGALVASRSEILSAVPCGPVAGCAAANGDVVPAPGPGQVVVAVTATYAVIAGR